jgi:hypothetical protein
MKLGGDMTILKEEIARGQTGTLDENDNWWRLCYDTEASKFYVEHEMDGLKPNNQQPYAVTNYHAAETWGGRGATEIPAAKQRLLKRASA